MDVGEIPCASALSATSAVNAYNPSLSRLWERAHSVRKSDHLLQPGQPLSGGGLERERELVAAVGLPASPPVVGPHFPAFVIRHGRVPFDGE